MEHIFPIWITICRIPFPQAFLTLRLFKLLTLVDETKIRSSRIVIKLRNPESILQNLFLRKNKDFSRFSILRLATVCTDNIFLCYKHSSLTSKIWKRRNQSLVGLTHGVFLRLENVELILHTNAASSSKSWYLRNITIVP